MPITITLNGDRREFDGPLTVPALLTALEIDPRMIALELNRTVVKRAAFGDTTVRDGDEVEIVAFVGGG